MALITFHTCFRQAAGRSDGVLAMITGFVKSSGGKLSLTKVWSAGASTVSAVGEKTDSALPFEAMPGPKGLPFVGTMFSGLSDKGNSHIHLRNMLAKYGSIYKERVGPMNLVILADVDGIKKLYHSDGKYPQRGQMPSWEYWREVNNKEKGLFTLTDGPTWRRVRNVLDKVLMRPMTVANFANIVHEVNSDFIKYLIHLRNDDYTVDHLDQLMFKWSIENIGAIMYERRLGAVSDSPNPETSRFIEAVNLMFESSEHLSSFPPGWSKYLSPKWHKKHDIAWSTIFEIGERLIDEKADELVDRIEAGEDVGGFLAALIGNENLSQKEIYANVADMMAAAIDTTSNTMQVMVWCLAKHPEVQDQIREEVDRVTSESPLPPSHGNLNMPYVKGVIKEVLRLYPPAMGGTRVLQEETELCGYKVPAKAMVVVHTGYTSRDPKLFKDPDAFRPERWIRGNEERDSLNPFSSIPFAAGLRSCVGRRIAELELQLLTIQLCKHFTIKPVNDKPLEFCTRLVTVPKTAVQAKFVDRN